jgi:hypothetical protein
MNILVIFDQGFDRVGSQLERDLVPQYHIHMDDICFDVNELVVEESLYQRVRVFAQFGVWSFWKHDRGEGPYCG